jgi:hypothetical protein
MKSQTTNENTDSSRFLRKMNSNALRPLAIAVLVLLVTVSYANAQRLPGLTPGSCPIGPTTCQNPACGGSNLCPSPQYRYGAATINGHYNPNADLTGNPIGDKNVLNSTTVSQLVLLTNTGAFSSGGCQSGVTSGIFPPTPSPSSSPSIESRIIFPALFYDVPSGNTYCALYTYDLLNPSHPQYMPFIGTAALPVVTSSPGYNGDLVVASEDGNVYSYFFPPSGLDWTFTNPALGGPVPFDSSPTTWPGLTYVYVVDVLGEIYYLDPGSGQPTSFSPVFSGVFPGGVLWNGPGFPYAPSASSLSVSTCANGPYSPCTMLFVAGSNEGAGDIVCAYNSLNGNSYWCKLLPGGGSPPRPW